MLFRSTSLSATPSEFTRCRMIETAWSIAAAVTVPLVPSTLGWSTTLVPPWRSRPNRTLVVPCKKMTEAPAIKMTRRATNARPGREVEVDTRRKSRGLFYLGLITIRVTPVLILGVKLGAIAPLQAGSFQGASMPARWPSALAVFE